MPGTGVIGSCTVCEACFVESTGLSLTELDENKTDERHRQEVRVNERFANEASTWRRYPMLLAIMRGERKSYLRHFDHLVYSGVYDREEMNDFFR